MKFRVIKPPRNIWDEKQKASIRALCFNLGLLFGFFWFFGFLKEYQLKQNTYMSIKISTGLCLLAVNLKLNRI